MATWEYATTHVLSEQHERAALSTATYDHATIQLRFSGVGPSGESIRGLDAILTAWADAGWELLTLTYQPIDLLTGTHDQPALPMEPTESAASVIDGQLAVFRRARQV